LKISIMGICMEDAFRRGMCLADFLARCSELGADGVELATRHLPGSAQERVGAARLARELGLEISSFNIGTDLVAAGHGARAQRERNLAAGVRTARVLDSRIMMVGTGRPVNVAAAEARKRIAAHLREAVEMLEGSDIRMTMENRGAKFADVVGRAADIKEICQAVDSPRFGWTFDTGNCVMAGEEKVERLLERVSAMFAREEQEVTHPPHQVWALLREN